MPRTFYTKNGKQILVGKNAKENSYLSLTFAETYDLFFHVADFPGSHVILRMTTFDVATLDDITDAAYLAFYYSQAKNRKKAKVNYTPIKYVSRPRNSELGLVELEKFKSVTVLKNEDIERRLLKSNSDTK